MKNLLIQNCKIKAIELLFEFGAKAGVVDNDGMHLLKIASVFQDVSTIFARAEAKRIREMNGAEKLAGLYRACELCKSDKESKRCTGIRTVHFGEQVSPVYNSSQPGVHEKSEGVRQKLVC